MPIDQHFLKLQMIVLELSFANLPKPCEKTLKNSWEEYKNV